jgi:hypothetical protein
VLRPAEHPGGRPGRGERGPRQRAELAPPHVSGRRRAVVRPGGRGAAVLPAGAPSPPGILTRRIRWRDEAAEPPRWWSDA